MKMIFLSRKEGKILDFIVHCDTKYGRGQDAEGTEE